MLLRLAGDSGCCWYDESAFPPQHYLRGILQRPNPCRFPRLLHKAARSLHLRSTQTPMKLGMHRAFRSSTDRRPLDLSLRGCWALQSEGFFYAVHAVSWNSCISFCGVLGPLCCAPTATCRDTVPATGLCVVHGRVHSSSFIVKASLLQFWLNSKACTCPVISQPLSGICCIMTCSRCSRYVV